jgi:hypothetical protein
MIPAIVSSSSSDNWSDGFGPGVSEILEMCIDNDWAFLRVFEFGIDVLVDIRSETFACAICYQG